MTTLRGFTVVELARRLGISRPTVYQAIREQRLTIGEDMAIRYQQAKLGRPRTRKGWIR